MTISSKRAEYLAWTSLVLNIVFFAIAFLIGRWSGFLAVFEVSWLILASVLIWFVLVAQFHQRMLAEQEKLDTTQLAGKDERTSAIFQAGDERAVLFAVAQKRLRLLEKWFIPIFSALIAAYQIAIGLYMLKKIIAPQDIEPKEPLLCAIAMTAVAFISFLTSRYATGMSAQQEWKPLRAGGSFMLGIAVICFAMAIGLALVQFKNSSLIEIIKWLIPAVLILLGLETALNVVLDIYRPRLKGQYHRSAFDSRLLGLINEPGGILRTAASAIDYQFGFKVSQTWFYKLLEKAVVPLILFAAFTLYLLSCVIIVMPNEGAIIEHLGNPIDKDGHVRTIGPGLSFKWPWPFDIAYKYPAKIVSEVNIGFVPKIDPKTKEVSREPLLWGKPHYEKEYSLLVASQSEQIGTGAAPVSIIIAAVPVQYRVKDLHAFIYNHSEPVKLLESICYQELTKFAASAKIEVIEEGQTSNGEKESLLGAGRSEAKKVLTERIQNACDKAGLGIEIVFLGVQGLHPPTDVAADYQKVVGAVQKKQAIILRSLGERNKVLSTLAGSVESADKLSSLASEYQQAEQGGHPEKLEQLGSDLDKAFDSAKGDIFSTLKTAQSYAVEKTLIAKAAGERFANQLKAYQAAKDIYKQQLRLSVLEESLGKIRKFLVVTDVNDTQVFVVDVKEKLTPSLYELGGIEETGKK